jgi:hypothetical protein
MTQDEIIEMARQAGFSIANGIVTGGVTDIKRFAELVAEKERESCAERAWVALVKHGQPWNVRQDVTNAIRARGQA